MPIHAERNLYKGVNPHLNSFLQGKGGGWETFHAAFLGNLTSYLDVYLPPNYYVLSEQSLQLTVQDRETGFEVARPSITIPDVLAYQRTPSTSATAPHPADTPTLVMPLLEMFDDEEKVLSALIYYLEGGRYPGKLITRLELISPANKPLGSDYGHYLNRRRETLRAGVRLVEIDLLHERPPMLEAMPSYRERDEGAFPYWVIVSDPRPDPTEGKRYLYGTSVNISLPVVSVPLEGEDSVRIDFGEIYDKTANLRAYRIVTDYAALPERFETYAPADQERIKARMAEIAAGQI